MELKVGDTVRFLNTTGGGVVSKIIDSKLIEVLDENGFNIPVLKTEVVLIPQNDTMSKNVNVQKNPTKEVIKEPVKPVLVPETNVEIKGNEIPKLYCAIVPQSSGLNEFDLYLINDCNYHFMFNFSSIQEEKLLTEESGILEANTKMYLKTYSKSQINENINFCIQGIFFKNSSYEMQNSVQRRLEISAVKFFKSGVFKENAFFDSDALILEIADFSFINNISEIDGVTIKSAISEKEIFNARRKELSRTENKEIQTLIEEVDLHIHELVENENGLEPADKLKIQLDHFEKMLNDAILRRCKKIIFIHGVGNGVLKMKMRNILDRQYPKLRYQDASFEKYKFGATLINL